MLEAADWIFDNLEFTQWMERGELRKQLPIFYRAFSIYCVLQRKLLGGRRIRKGPELFSFLRQLGVWHLQPSDTKIVLPQYSVYVNLLDPRFLRVISELLDENNESKAINYFLQEGDTFLDVGANHGSFSIMAAQSVGASGHIVAIEPQKNLADLIYKSLSENAICPFDVKTIACGDRNGEVEFYISHGTSGTAGIFSSFSAAFEHQSVKVLMVTFDDAFDWRALPGNILLKLDVEGSEFLFLKGAKEFISARMPTILIEINPETLKAAGISWQEISQFLEKFGYSSYVELNQLEKQLPLSNLNSNFYRNVLILGRGHLEKYKSY